MTLKALTGYQAGLGVLCAIGLALAIWLTSSDPTITYQTTGDSQDVSVTCVFSGDDVGADAPGGEPGYRIEQGTAALDGPVGRKVFDGDASRVITTDCARAERARLRTVVWVLAGVLAVGVVLMGTVIVRIGRRRPTQPTP